MTRFQPFRSSKGISFSFNLPESRPTSAGIYDTSDKLIRTLWSGEYMPAGITTRNWDQRDDSGSLQPAGTYKVKLIYSNLSYIWDGCIGNSSYPGGDIQKLHTSINPPVCIVSVPGKVYYTGGYNEGQPFFSGFDDKTPQSNDQIPSYLVDPFCSIDQFTVDETRLYFVSYGGFANTKCFVFALGLSTPGSKEIYRPGFSAGTPLCLNYSNPLDLGTCYWDQNYSSNHSGSGGAIMIKNDLSNVPSGIAVQRFGSVLAVAYPSENKVRTFNKLTGVEGPSINVSLLTGRLNQICMTTTGDLLVISGTNQVRRYVNIDSDPVLFSTLTLPTVDPLAITSDPNDGRYIWLVDGGSNQQVMGFDANGNLVRTVGVIGGSTSNANVSLDRFNFTNGAGRQRSAIAVDTNGNVWVSDTANGRMLKFDPVNTQSVGSIEYRGISYAAAVDSGNPTRVFSNFMEYSVNYMLTLDNRASWTLVKNWLSAMPEPYRSQITTPYAFSGFKTVRTLSNGRTYGLCYINDVPVMFELTPDNQLRPLPPLRAKEVFSNPNPFGPGTLNGGDTNLIFYENGDLGFTTNLYPEQVVYRLFLSGFDSSNNPQWGPYPVKLASIPLYAPNYEKTAQYNWGPFGPRFPLTSTNLVVWFNNSEIGDGYHLGAVPLGGTSFQWQSSKAGVLDFKGKYQTREYNSGLEYGGNLVFTLGRSIFYGYHGEFYRDASNSRVGQANQFMHFYDNGLFVGQFGVPGTLTTKKQKGSIGNAFCWSIVSHNSHTYLYSNDESSFGGVTRWRIDGLDSIRELSGVCATGNSVTLS